MKRRKNQTLRTSVLMLLLLLGIGYAALAANLKIDGLVNVSKSNWDVHFENVQQSQGSVTPTTAPTTDEATTTEMSYTVNLTQPGEYYEFTVDIVNNGTIDAMIDTVSNKVYESTGTTERTLPAYLKSTVTYADGVTIAQNHLLPKKNGNTKTVETIKVRVEFRTDINPSDLPSTAAESVMFKFIANYKQANNNAVPKPVWALPEGKTKDNLTVGDEICTQDQCFNFIKYTGTNNEDVVMLAKYNLKVGNIYDISSYAITGEYTSSDTGYGLQSSEARGYVSDESIWKGTVAFSTTNYWDDNGSPSSSYPGSYSHPDYPTIYDAENYSGAPGELDEYGVPTNPSYSIAYYVEQYKAKLTSDYNAIIKNARLLTYTEAIDSSIGCDGTSNYNCPTTGFITNTSFWLGSAYIRGINVWNIREYGSFNGNNRNNSNDFGVRPVLVISKSNM